MKRFLLITGFFEGPSDPAEGLRAEWQAYANLYSGTFDQLTWEMDQHVKAWFAAAQPGDINIVGVYSFGCWRLFQSIGSGIAHLLFIYDGVQFPGLFVQNWVCGAGMPMVTEYYGHVFDPVISSPLAKDDAAHVTVHCPQEDHFSIPAGGSFPVGWIKAKTAAQMQSFLSVFAGLTPPKK